MLLYILTRLLIPSVIMVVFERGIMETVPHQKKSLIITLVIRLNSKIVNSSFHPNEYSFGAKATMIKL